MNDQKKSHMRIPPHNLEAEQALLGSIMLRPEVMYEITDIAHTVSFYSEKHRLIFETMLDLWSKRNPTDLLTVSARLKEKKLLEDIGGNSYLSELVNSVPSATNANYYAQIIQKKHIARNLIGAGDFVSSLGYDEAEELEELLDQAQKKIYDVTNISSIHKFIEMKDELTSAVGAYSLKGEITKLHICQCVTSTCPWIHNKVSSTAPGETIMLKDGCIYTFTTNNTGIIEP